jgi:hypothetical protein
MGGRDGQVCVADCIRTLVVRSPPGVSCLCKRITALDGSPTTRLHHTSFLAVRPDQAVLYRNVSRISAAIATTCQMPAKNF